MKLAYGWFHTSSIWLRARCSATALEFVLELDVWAALKPINTAVPADTKIERATIVSIRVMPNELDTALLPKEKRLFFVFEVMFS